MVPADGEKRELKIILLTGLPGVGKTTMVNRLAEYYRGKGLKVSGIMTREVRDTGVRVGFKIADMGSGREGWLARKDYPTGPRIGSYRVVSEDLQAIGVNALRRATDGPTDIIIVDEIGPMEMTSSPFREILSKVLIGNRPTIATVKSGSNYLEIERIRRRSLELEVTKDNRETIYHKLIERVNAWIEDHGS